MKKILLFYFLLFTTYAFSQTYKVIGIKDGDTVSILMEGTEKTVRLAHIDCPEKKQPFGNKAKEAISALCFGKLVTLIGNGKKDRNGRLIAELILPNGINVNKTLVKLGLAWHFKKYSKDQDYANLEITARNKKVGLWKDPHSIAPWDWRKSRKISSKINKSFTY